MFTKLWENGGKLLGYMLMAVGVLAFREKRYAGWFVGAALALFIIYTMKPFQWYNADLTYLLSALVLTFALAPSLLQSFNPSLVIGAAILSVATLGTDTAWLKLFPAVLCLLPVALTQYKTFAEQRYLYEVLFMLCVMTVTRMTHNSVGQSDLTKVQTISTVSPYKGIAIREIEEERMMQYKADFDSLRLIANSQQSFLSLGQENHLMRAVTGCEAARYNEFWSNIFDSVYTVKYRDIIVAEHPIVFCSFSPQFKTKPLKDKESMMENMLREQGYREIDRSKYKYMIYIPTTNDQEIQ